MANKNLKSIKFPGLTDTYVVPQVDDTLTQTGRPADAKATGDAISALGDSVDTEIDALKEDLSTLNTEGTVPTSEQMLSDNYTTDSVPYHFRKTASDNADREELEIVGGSVAWNQLVKNPNFAVETSWYVYKSSIQYSDNTLLVTPTESGFVSAIGSIKEGAVNHKYLVIFDAKTTDVTYKLYCSLSSQSISTNVVFSNKPFATANTWQTFSAIAIPTDASVTMLRVALYTEDINVTYSLRNVGLFDLTAMFGSTIADHIYSLEQATAGAGVSLFRSLFPKDYYAYDAGSMQSVSGLSEHRTTGANLFNPSGSINSYYLDEAGTLKSTNGWVVSDYIPVPSNVTLYFNPNTVSGAFAKHWFYDADKVEISYIDSGPQAFTTPSNCKYMRFSYRDISTNIMLNYGSEAMTYVPYEELHSYALDDSLTLRGVPTLVDGKIKFDGDIYSPSGKVTRRYGIVDLGTLTWSTIPQTSFNLYAASISNMTTQYSYSTPENDIRIVGIPYSYKGVNASWSTMNDKTFGLAGATVRIRDDLYADSAAFKAAMNGKYIVYLLATPTTEQADPYVSPQICHYDGTEEFVSTGIVPVGHNTKYPDNMRAKLDGLPWNFASLIAPTESGFKATRNYTTGALLIVNNTLYKATANIANGATITPNTNVTATTLAEVISALS